MIQMIDLDGIGMFLISSHKTKFFDKTSTSLFNRYR